MTPQNQWEAAQALVTAFSGHHHVFGDTMREITARFAIRRLRGMLEQKAGSLSECGDDGVNHHRIEMEGPPW